MFMFVFVCCDCDEEIEIEIQILNTDSVLLSVGGTDRDTVLATPCNFLHGVGHTGATLEPRQRNKMIASQGYRESEREVRTQRVYYCNVLQIFITVTSDLRL